MRIISFADIRNCILKYADSEMDLRDCFGSHAFFILICPSRLQFSFKAEGIGLPVYFR